MTNQWDRLHDPAVFQRSRDTLRARLDAEFWAKTDRSSGCWVWTGARQNASRKSRGGYGFMHRHGRIVFAHRRAYEMAKGPIPDGLLVLHSCDNPPCINPDHLRVGTYSDNTLDAVARGRHRCCRLRKAAA